MTTLSKLLATAGAAAAVALVALPASADGYKLFETRAGGYTDLVVRLDAKPTGNLDFVTALKFLFDRQQIKNTVYRNFAVIGNDQPIDPSNLNLASIAGTLPTPGLATYGATKAAVIALTRSLNAELDASGVRAIAICPGFVDTPMAQWSGIEPAEMIRPEDCAEVVRMALRLSPHARVPQVVIERVGAMNGDVP